jgi:Ethylene-responsive protein kinase Le-CTR1
LLHLGAMSRRAAQRLKEERRSVVVPIGLIRVGLARHRALLFKYLADETGVLRCCVVRGKAYTGERARLCLDGRKVGA